MKHPTFSALSICLCLLLALVSTNPAQAAGKVDLLFGGFKFKTSRGPSSELSGLGSYQIGFRYPFLLRFEVQLGYSLVASKVFGGDLGFGPDFGIIYYPFTASTQLEARSAAVDIKIQNHYKPYVTGGFHQRQYQSNSSSYAGFSGAGGVEYMVDSRMFLKLEYRLIQLRGPSNAQAIESDTLFGIVYPF